MEHPVRQQYYGKEYEITFDGHSYKLQAEKKTNSKKFLLSQPGKLGCTISMSEEGEWQSNCGLSHKQLSEIGDWIKKLYE
jgi:hypothetical protein